MPRTVGLAPTRDDHPPKASSRLRAAGGPQPGAVSAVAPAHRVFTLQTACCHHFTDENTEAWVAWSRPLHLPKPHGVCGWQALAGPVSRLCPALASGLCSCFHLVLGAATQAQHVAQGTELGQGGLGPSLLPGARAETPHPHPGAEGSRISGSVGAAGAGRQPPWVPVAAVLTVIVAIIIDT